MLHLHLESADRLHGILSVVRRDIQLRKRPFDGILMGRLKSP